MNVHKVKKVNLKSKDELITEKMEYYKSTESLNQIILLEKRMNLVISTIQPISLFHKQILNFAMDLIHDQVLYSNLPFYMVWE